MLSKGEMAMKINKKQLMRIIKEETSFVLKEASFGRVKRKIEDMGVPFVMISAFRGGLSGRENLIRQRTMENSVSSAGFPFMNMPGSGYAEDVEDGEGKTEVKENSILIWDEERPDAVRMGITLPELAQGLATLYDQDSYIYGDGSSIRAYDRDGMVIDEPWAGPWSSIHQVSDDNPYWSTLAGKRTALAESLAYWKSSKAGSQLGARRKQYHVKTIQSAIDWLDRKNGG